MMHPRNTENDAADDDRYHHGDLRRSLIAAALALLTEEQDWGFSLRAVARRAKVSHNAPYNHFNSKRDLLAAVAAAGFDSLRERMQEASARAKTPAAALQAVGVAYVRFGVENPAHYRLMFGTALSAADNCPPPAVAESAASAKGLLRDIIRRGAEQGAFALPPAGAEAQDTAVLAAWSLVHGLTTLLIDGLAAARTAPGLFPAPDAERIAAHVTRLLLDGMRVRGTS